MTPQPLNDTARELERIQINNHGLLRAVDVVREAADPASPIHDRFTWDDTEAGHQWRLQQARQLIRYVVGQIVANNQPREFRVYVSLMQDRTQQDGGYRVMVDVMSLPAWRAQLLTEALAEMRRFQIRFHELTELSNVFAAIAAAQAQHRQQQGPPPATPGGGLPAQI